MINKDETGKWNNRSEDGIVLEPHNPHWAEMFAYEQQAIREGVDASIPLVIEHFGSTAIPDLPAKPIIDILVGASSQHWKAIIEALKGQEYIHWETNPHPDREFLVKGMPPFGVRRTHHVHICEIGGSLWEQLLFRDYLREHPEDRKAYASLKEHLAAAFPEDREAYTRGKDKMVAQIMNRARTWHSA